jgi:hypothetical protein
MLPHLALAVKNSIVVLLTLKDTFLVSPGLSSTISKPLAL